MSDVSLQRPVWNSLSGRQSHLAMVRGAAVRLDPNVGPFAAVRDESDAAFDELFKAMALQATPVLTVESADFRMPQGCSVLESVALLQMTHDGRPVEPAHGLEIDQLVEEDAAEMTALASATQPGPWRERSHTFGKFFGIRREGRLIAMAGERMRPASDLAEVSGVCTLPEFQGQGIAAALVRHVIAGFAAQGERAFLHCNAQKTGAIRLYEKLGFSATREMVATVPALA